MLLGAPRRSYALLNKDKVRVKDAVLTSNFWANGVLCTYAPLSLWIGGRLQRRRKKGLRGYSGAPSGTAKSLH